MAVFVLDCWCLCWVLALPFPLVVWAFCPHSSDVWWKAEAAWGRFFPDPLFPKGSSNWLLGNTGHSLYSLNSLNFWLKKRAASPGSVTQLVGASSCTSKTISGSVPGPGECGRQLISVSLSHRRVSLSPFLSLSNQWACPLVRIKKTARTECFFNSKEMI